MTVHSVQCPKCLSKITDPDEIDFVKENGMCFTCDHHSVFDEMEQDELDDYFNRQ